MKRFLSIMIIVATIISLASCGGENNGNDSEESTMAETIINKVESTADETKEALQPGSETDTEAFEESINESSSETADVIESGSDSVVETEPEASRETEDTAKGTDEESAEETTEETAEETTEETVDNGTITPANGEIVILANDDVYGWWDGYHPNKTGYTDPFYLHEDIYFPIPVKFSWEADEKADYYRLFISTDKDFSADKTESYLVNENSLELDHLFTGTKYYWQVFATEIVDGEEINSLSVSPVSFTTAESPRCLRIEGVSNTRDIGGIRTSNGYRIKQGMIYRGGKLEKMTPEGKAYFRDYIGLTTDLDLRTPGEGGAGDSSPLGSDINYVNIDGRYYTGSKGINTAEGKAIFAEEIRLFANPDNYPIYIHCSLGRDRTGTLVFVIEALLGVSKNNLFMDYELSVFSVTGTQDNASVSAIKNNITNTYNYISENYEGSTFAEKTENYLLDIGITPEEIQTIRDLLLEEIE